MTRYMVSIHVSLDAVDKEEAAKQMYNFLKTAIKNKSGFDVIGTETLNIRELKSGYVVDS